MSSTGIGVVWFTPQKTHVGIVLTHDPITDKLKARIGMVTGDDESADIESIMETGAKFPVAEAITLVGNHGDWLVPQAEAEKLTEKEADY